MNRYTPILSALLCATCLGCLKYTPSHSELREKYGAQDVSLNELGGTEEFKKYEIGLSSRLETLTRERAYLLSPALHNGGQPVGAGDELQVTIFGFGDLSANSSIASDGSVILPLVGRVDIAGKPLDEVQTELTQRYAHFIRSPQVKVSMKTPLSNRVSVTGEVHKPGTYPLPRKGTLLTELLAEAGGRTPNASSRIIVLPAPQILESPQLPSPGAPQLSLVSDSPAPHRIGVEIDEEDLVGGIDRPPLLLPLIPGDTIIVPEAGNFEVDGEVVQPGSFKLSSRTSVMGAIAAARGFTYSAAVNNVELIRDTGAGRKALITLDLEEVGLRGGQDLRLRNGDLVRVPSEPGRFFKQQIVETINGLFSGVGANKRIN